MVEVFFEAAPVAPEGLVELARPQCDAVGIVPVTPVDGSLASARWTFDYPAFAPSGTVTLDMVGKARTVSCVIDQKTLASFR